MNAAASSIGSAVSASIDGPGLGGLPLQPNAARQVALRIHVDEEDALFR